MQSHKLSDAVHILAFIEIFGRAEGSRAEGSRAAGAHQVGSRAAAEPVPKSVSLSSASIAASVESNPALVRRLMSALAKAGLLDTKPGSVEPRLARSTADISLLDVYRAVEGNDRLLQVDEKTNIACPIGGNIQQTLDDVYARVQADAEASMAATSLASIVDNIMERQKVKDYLAVRAN
jgi:DNA-binding IscR family transcriptional regulator